jgi:hypothetical protein
MTKSKRLPVKSLKENLADLALRAENTTIGDALRILEAYAEPSDIAVGETLFEELDDSIRGHREHSVLQTAIACLLLARKAFIFHKAQEMNAGIAPDAASCLVNEGEL